MGRIGAVEEVAEGIYWLCTESAGCVTGTVLPVSVDQLDESGAASLIGRKFLGHGDQCDED